MDTMEVFYWRQQDEAYGKIPVWSDPRVQKDRKMRMAYNVLSACAVHHVTTWYVEGTDEPFDTGSAITEDIVLYAILPEQVEN